MYSWLRKTAPDEDTKEIDGAYEEVKRGLAAPAGAQKGNEQTQGQQGGMQPQKA